MITGKRILMTGGRGFLGSHLVKRLHADNHIIVVDNMRRDALQYITEIEAGKHYEFHQRDVTEEGALDDLLEGTNIVIHLAAVAGVSNYVKHPATTLENNLLGTYRVLRSIRGRNIDRFLNYSTSEVYGPKAVSVQESQPTVQGPIGEARWSYAVSKTAAEHLCFAYHQEYDLPTVSVRPFNIFGPGQVGEGAVHDISMRALRDETVGVTGDGKQVRTWCFIDDMTDASMLLLTRPEAVGKVFNVGNSEPVVPMLELAQKIIELAGSSSKIEFVKHIEADVMLRSPNVTRIKQELGFSPQVPLEIGLKKAIDWYREHLDASSAV